MKVLLSIMVIVEFYQIFNTIENRKLSYRGNIGVVMCLRCMNRAGAPPVWKIYDGGFSFTGH